MRLLIIEDEAPLMDSMLQYLTGEQYRCDTARDFPGAREKLDHNDYDCILLDITLPGGNGLELLRELKLDRKQDGVIVISARNSLDDRIHGLKLGADDYLPKPFHLSELSARIAAVIRRKQFQGENILRLGDIEIHLQERSALVHGNPVELTRKEFDLLVFFAANKNKVVSKGAISAHLSGDEQDWPDNDDLVYTHIKNLKKKLAEQGCVDFIKSIYGVGYKIQI